MLRIPRFILIFFAVDVALGAAYVLNYVIGGPSRWLTLMLNLNGEANLPAWYASIQWFCVAALLGMFAYGNLDRKQRTSWLLVLVPLVFLAFSLDEVAQIHEWVGIKSDALLAGGSRLNTPFPRTGIWVFLIGVPFLFLFAALIFSVRAYFQRAPGAFLRMVLGMAIMLAGAMGVELLYNLVARNSGYEVVQVFIEEMCELIGGTVVLWGSYGLLRSFGFSRWLDKVEAVHER